MATTSTKWQQKRDASYAALVQAAMRRFGELGYAATRVEDIVEGTGYSKGAFYFHFANKLECFWHVIDYRRGLRGDWAEQALQTDPAHTSLEDLVRGLRDDFARATGGQRSWALVMVECFQQTRDDEAARARLRETYRQWHEELARFARALQAGGWVGAAKDPAMLAAQAFAYLEGLTIHAALYGLDGLSLEDAFSGGLTNLLRGGAD